MELRHGDYLISDASERLDAAAIHAYLTQSYWAEGISLEVVTRALQASLSLGVYAADGAQVGLVRIISDFATFAYVCDVYVLEEHRGHGLAKATLKAAFAHPKLQGLRRINLVTRDAHSLYSRFGFIPVVRPERYMEKLDPDLYRRLSTVRP
jgi:GNAT superfamily N-acetyltransferase